MKNWNSAVLLGLALTTVGCAKNNDCNPCLDQQYVHKYGMEVRPDYWTSRGANGKVISTLRDGVVVSQSFENGVLEGDCVYKHVSSNRILKVETYSQDRICKEVIYNTCGSPEESIEWVSPTMQIVTKWYEGGNPRSVEKYDGEMLLTGDYYDRKHHRDSWVYDGEGERMMRDSYGHFLSKDDFRGGQMVARTYYHPNGSPCAITPFDNGVVCGMRKTYYPGGEPHTIEEWKNGNQNGTTMIFQNGMKFSEVYYLDGKKNGVEKRFGDGQNVSQEITWFDNKMHGPSFTYIGDSIQTDYYYHGRLTTRSNFESFSMPKRG